MLEELKKLVTKLSGEDKSKVLAEIERLEKLNPISRPTNLDEFLKDKESADLKSQYDSRIGSHRTTWEKETAEKAAEKKTKKELEDKLKDPEKKEGLKLEDIQSLLDNSLKGVNDKIELLSSSKQIEDLKVYASDKVKDLPENLQKMISVTEHTTKEMIDEQFANASTVHESYMKNVNDQPTMGADGKVSDSALDKVLDEFGEDIKQE